MEAKIAVPDHIRWRYMRGKCLAFAIAMKRELGLPIYVVVDNLTAGQEDWHHAFVVDREIGVALDIRGVMPLEVAAVADGMMHRGRLSMRPASISQISLAMSAFPTRAEVDDARSIVRRYLMPIFHRLRAETDESGFRP